MPRCPSLCCNTASTFNSFYSREMKMKTCGRLITAGYFLSVFLLSACVQSSTAASPAVSATAGSNAAAASAGSGSVDATSMIAAHNEWRAKVGVPGLKWSEKLEGIAQQWADHLAATTCSGGHSGNEYGENIFMASAAHVFGRQA